ASAIPSPSAWLGIALAGLTIVLVSADGGTRTNAPALRRRALALAAVSGAFIGVFLIAFERAGTSQQLLPLLVARTASLPLVALALLLRRQRPWPRSASPAAAIASGVFDFSANGFYLFALARAPISTVATLSNLYPAFTVLLGVLVLRDRPRPVQQLGLGFALAAIVLITR
ncbi:MAG: DMT family transporter, partial [Planctomycetes bacterium]|nr:DMT family transporter [Planctomycetota bacterium]